ncbi:gamma-secretase subunit APH-1B-like [Oscarella lobularis]|uniref:gamma-secretase subunit APH-1B-like n=1 Tax=Oscarella lobularis TaxID=121494 RepID=UPI003313949E
MGLKSFFGAAMIAFGIPLWLFVFAVAGKAENLVVFLSSSFFWLLSLFFTGCVWRLVTVKSDDQNWQLFIGVIVAILFQELFRYFFYRVIRRGERFAQELGVPIVYGPKLAFIAGLGYGVASGAFAFFNVLADSVGPGSVWDSDDGVDGVKGGFFLISAFHVLCFILLNTALGIIWFAGFEKKSWMMIAIAAVIHLIASLFTAGSSVSGIAALSLVPNYFILAGTVMYAFRTSGIGPGICCK